MTSKKIKELERKLKENQRELEKLKKKSRLHRFLLLSLLFDGGNK